MVIGILNSNYCSFSEEYSDIDLVLGSNIAIHKNFLTAEI